METLLSYEDMLIYDDIRFELIIISCFNFFSQIKIINIILYFRIGLLKHRVGIFFGECREKSIAKDHESTSSCFVQVV